jgi:DNA-binding response OmpR family regulator
MADAYAGCMHEHLLLVEDDDAIADALRLHLEQAGYRRQREADGLQAMRRSTASDGICCCWT